MRPISIVLIGFVLLSSGVAPVHLEATDGHSPILTEPPDCDDPIERPIVGKVEDPAVIGTVARHEANRSLVNITYNVSEGNPDDNLHITIPENSTLISHSQTLSKQDDESLSGRLNRSQFWVVFDPGSVWGTEYPSREEWLLTPTPDHSSNVALTPANEGVIGRNIMWLGDNEIVTRNSSCQTFRVVQPPNANFESERKLKTLDSAARVLDFGHRYSSILIFAVPELDGQLAGFVPGYDNEIVLEGTASVHSPDNVWIHEYVHTTQFEQYEGDLSWLNEGAAEYYAARTSLELDLISDLEYDVWLSQNQGYDPDIPLAEAKHEDVAYNWGSAVLAETAARAYSTDSDSTFISEYDDIDQYGTSDYDDFESALNRLGLNESYVNSTKQSIISIKRPEVNAAYQTPYGRYAELMVYLRWLTIGLGVFFLIKGLHKARSEGD